MPCAGQIRRVIFCLAFLPTLGGRTGVLCCRRGKRRPPAWEGGAWPVCVAWGLPGVPLRGPAPGAAGLTGVIAHTGTQMKRGL